MVLKNLYLFVRGKEEIYSSVGVDGGPYHVVLFSHVHHMSLDGGDNFLRPMREIETIETVCMVVIMTAIGEGLQCVFVSSMAIEVPENNNKNIAPVQILSEMDGNLDIAPVSVTSIIGFKFNEL